MATVRQGCLAIGDITGYTKYLAKLEGDAVFCSDRDDG